MPIYDDFRLRLNRSHDRAQQIAQGSTPNRQAWLEQTRDLAVMKKLFEEGTLFIAETERRADVGLANAQTLETLSIQQAEDASAAKMIGDNTDLFEHHDVGTVKALLETIDPLVFGEAWRRLSEEKRTELTMVTGV